MIAIITALSGRKTYIIGFLVVIIGLMEGPLGMDIPGVETGDDWLMYILNGLGLGTLRAGIAKAAWDGIGSRFKWIRLAPASGDDA